MRDFELTSAADVLQAPSSLLVARLGLRGGTERLVMRGVASPSRSE